MFFRVEEPVGTFPAVFVIMFYFIIAQFFSLVLDFFIVRRRTDRQKDLEILLLRQQLT